ncbi:MAG: nucleoside-diphosphate kinase [Bacteroidaceae bacterium]|mgnify:FL=1|nr:nucleoside-diphosphate kinase [Bacteroidaceae bacterium]
MERTFVILKPCTLQRGLVGEVISRFEKKGLKLVAMKMYRFTKEKCAQHYAHLVSKPFYPIIESSMMAAPVILCCWEGIDAVSVVREMTGATNGRNAAPGTVRGDFCMSHQENIVHASDSQETAKAELERFFTADDYFEYDSPLFDYLYAKDEL